MDTGLKLWAQLSPEETALFSVGVRFEGKEHGSWAGEPDQALGP